MPLVTLSFYFRQLAGGIDSSIQVAINSDLCLRMSEVTQVAHVAKELYFYRTHQKTISHGQRVEQILASTDAISRALLRRGLSERYQIDVEIVGQFFLRRKAGTPS